VEKTKNEVAQEKNTNRISRLVVAARAFSLAFLAATIHSV
jgi:hypothetical protein